MSGAWARACDSHDTNGDHAVWAAVAITQALAWRNPRERVQRVEYAGAHLRAWRKSLPEQGARMDDREYYATPDALLWNALALVCDAWGWADRREVPLRSAESALRTWWKRQQGRVTGPVQEEQP